MRFSFHPDAEAEFDQAVAYYEAKQGGLGLSLADEVLVAVTRILYPIAGQSLAPKIPSLKRKTPNEVFLHPRSVLQIHNLTYPLD